MTEREKGLELHLRAVLDALPRCDVFGEESRCHKPALYKEIILRMCEEHKTAHADLLWSPIAYAKTILTAMDYLATTGLASQAVSS